MGKFNLKWNYTNKMVNDLLEINRAKEVVDLLELPISIEEEIKKETIAKRVHYSTKIEGNILNLKEAKDVKSLIKQMLMEFSSKKTKDIPIPIKARILAYEFVTIHPFWDENEYLRQKMTYL